MTQETKDRIVLGPQRPPNPEKFQRGDALIIRERFRRTTERIPVRVTKVGRVWLTVVQVGNFDTEREHWSERKFLLADMQEGAPSKRVGFAASIATPEQETFDCHAANATAYLRNVAGLSIEWESPFKSDGARIVLADRIRELLEGRS